MDRPGVRQVPRGSGERRKIEETGSEVICGAPTILAVKGEMKMMKMKACGSLLTDRMHDESSVTQAFK